MRIIEVKVFKYSELSEEAKEKALNALSGVNVDFNWWDNTYEDAQRIGCRIKHFDQDAQRIGFDLNLDASVVAQKIMVEHGIGCDTRLLAEAFLLAEAQHGSTGLEEFEEWCTSGGREALCEEFEHDLGEEYLSLLRKEYEYLTSRGVIEEGIEVNDYEFTEDGELV